jgi:hypothetical protein
LNDFNDLEESVNNQKVQSEYSNPPTHTGRTNSNPTHKPSIIPTFIPEMDMEETQSMGGGEGIVPFGPPQGESQGLINGAMDENDITKLFDQI